MWPRCEMKAIQVRLNANLVVLGIKQEKVNRSKIMFDKEGECRDV